MEMEPRIEMEQVTSHPSHSAPPCTASKFEFFPLLPVEIQLMIWETVLKEGRIARVHRSASDLTWRSPCPPLLQVNFQARAAALEHYELRFGGKMYINFRTDTVFFNPGYERCFDSFATMCETAAVEDVRQIRRLALGVSSRGDFEIWCPSWMVLFRGLVKVHTLTFYKHDDACSSCSKAPELDVHCPEALDIKHLNLEKQAKHLKWLVTQIRRRRTRHGRFLNGKLEIQTRVAKRTFCCDGRELL